MYRKLAFGLAALLIVTGIAVASYLGGWWPGANADSQGALFEQSRVDDLRADVSAATTAGTDMAAASPAGKEILRQQGNAVTAHACAISSQIHPLPADLGAFIQANCADGQVSPTSEFADSTGGATPSNDPDPGAN
jgi:hypothetical protein